MNDHQRQYLGDAFLLLGANSRRGRQIARDGTLEDVQRHIVEMTAMLAAMKDSVDIAAGAGNVLRRAKTLLPLVGS